MPSPVKLLPLLLSFCLTAGAACAEDREQKASPAAGPRQEQTRKNCPLCKVPGRAALLAGNAKARPCATSCANLCCKGTELVLLLEGIATTDGARKVTAALSRLKDVEVRGVLPESGRTILNYNSTQLSAARVRSTLERAGFKIAGELRTFKIAGLAKPGATEILVEVLASTTGVSAIDTVCAATGQAIIEYDPARTSPQRLTAAINTTPCKVIP